MGIVYFVRIFMHSVESPSMVDPQWNIWYWGSKWILHTVCWSVVGCEWGTTSVYFGITYVCFIPSRLPVFAVEPQYLLQYFLFLSKVSFELHIQNLQKISCWFKIWMGFVGPILIQLWTSSIFSCLCEGLPGIAYANMLVTTQWPLKRADHLTSLVWVCVLWLPWKLNGAICTMKTDPSVTENQELLWWQFCHHWWFHLFVQCSAFIMQ